MKFQKVTLNVAYDSSYETAIDSLLDSVCAYAQDVIILDWETSDLQLVQKEEQKVAQG